MNIKNFKFKNIVAQKAFGLINASIIIATVIVFSATTFAISEVNNKIKKQNIDSQKIEKIYNAMGRFLLKNKRLPCPALLNVSKGRSNLFGVESGVGDSCIGKDGVYSFDPSFSTNSNLLYGGVPVVSLGLPTEFAEDQFGSKLIYIIDRRVTYESLGSNTNTINVGTISGSTIIVKENGVNTTDNAMFLIMSNGRNKFRAFDVNGVSPRGASTSVNEIENGFTNIVTTTIQMNNVFIKSAVNDNIFDDYVFFKNKVDLINDFDANFLVPCINAGTSFGNANASFNQVVYSSVPCPNENTVRAVKKCGNNGNWVYVKSCKCYNNTAGVIAFYTPNGVGLAECQQANYKGIQKYNCDENGSLTVLEPCQLK